MYIRVFFFNESNKIIRETDFMSVERQHRYLYFILSIRRK